MTITTRRRVFLAVLLVALTMPAETILLRAIQSPSDKAAAKDWVAALTDAELAGVAGRLQSYPFVYRQSIMARLSPEDRASVWQSHIQGYVARHPELDGGARDLLKAAESALTPRALSEPTPEDRASMTAVAKQVEASLGRDEAAYLLYEIGPAQGTFASAEPFSMKLASFVRNRVVLLARNYDCECSSDDGCFSYGGACSNEEFCYWDVTWPMCGYGWMSVCDGMCRVW